MSTKKRGLADNPLFTKTESEPQTRSIAGATHQATPTTDATHQFLPPQESQITEQDHTPYQAPSQVITTLTEESIDQSTDRQTDRSPHQPLHQPPLRYPTRPIMNRPSAFYLYEEQSEDLDALVNLLKKEHKIKTDRSALMRAILTEPVLNFHDRTHVQELINRLMQQSMSRLIGQ